MPITVNKTHPKLNWLISANKPRVVPGHIARAMSALQTIEQAQDFAGSAGLNVISGIKKTSRTAHAVTLAAPAGLEQYYGPQIILPYKECEELPFGSALMSCLLPPKTDITEVERVFMEYQKMTLAFVEKMGALPFACITGQKTKEGNAPHDLFSRGFRLFFSPVPDKSYARIYDILNVATILFSPDTSSAEGQEAVRQLSLLKICSFGGEEIGHSMLEDVMVYETDPMLVDLRS